MDWRAHSSAWELRILLRATRWWLGKVGLCAPGVLFAGLLTRCSVRNILFSNFLVMGADAGPSISEDSGDNGSFPGTSLMGISDVSFVNFTGYLSGNEKATQAETVSCSNVHPCYNIAYDNVTLTLNENTTATGSGQCSYISPGGVHGLTGDGC